MFDKFSTAVYLILLILVGAFFIKMPNSNAQNGNNEKMVSYTSSLVTHGTSTSEDNRYPASNLYLIINGGSINLTKRTSNFVNKTDYTDIELAPNETKEILVSDENNDIQKGDIILTYINSSDETKPIYKCHIKEIVINDKNNIYFAFENGVEKYIDRDYVRTTYNKYATANNIDVAHFSDGSEYHFVYNKDDILKALTVKFK